jgi:predicted DNA-binding transcriptional regulator YafY
MSVTILRQWHVLTMLPKPPRRIDTGSIEARLRERGIEVHRRTIQRDLLELAEVFPIVADERARPYGWRWSDDAGPLFEVPAPNRAPYASGIDVSLRVRRTAMPVVSEQLGARRAKVSDDARDPLFAIVLAALDDSSRTRRLLLAHGDEIEVVSPLALRRDIADRARRVFVAHAR